MSVTLSEEMGYHKAMAGFWYKITLTILDMILGFIISGVFVKYVYPFPESKGYASITAGFFAIVYTVMDIATWGTVERFIPEQRIKDPKVMLQYLQFIIWYQSFSGLLQITGLSYYALFIANETNLSYAVWFMLLNVAKQFPGYAGLFKNVLNAYQEYTKVALIDFVQGNICQRITEVGFILLGKWYGTLHPEIGQIMGMAFGFSIGTYLDDVIIMVMELVYFKKVTIKDGFELTECWGHDFKWPVVKNCLNWGWKQAFPSVIASLFGFYSFTLTITYVPSYATWSTIASMAGTLVWFIGMGPGSPIPLYTESYMNGKKELTGFYFGQHFRTSIQLAWMFASAIAPIILFLPDAFKELDIMNYMLTIPFITGNIIALMVNAVCGQGEGILYGANKANKIMLLKFLWMAYDAFFQTLWLAWMQLPLQYGVNGVVFYMTYAGLITGIPKAITYYYLASRIVKLKVPWWQTFGASTIAAAIVALIGFTFTSTAYRFLYSQIGFYGAVVPTVIVLLVVGFFGYFPITAMLGGWDTETLAYLDYSVKNSGPSKWIAKPIYFLVLKACKKSPLHNRFGLDPTIAHQQIQELLELKATNQLKQNTE